MNTEIRTAVGQILSGHAPLTALLRHGAKSVYYGTDLAIPVKDSMPLIQFFGPDEQFDLNFSQPDEKLESPFQVNVVSGTESLNEQIANLIVPLLQIPVRRKSPIATASWLIDRCYTSSRRTYKLTVETVDGLRIPVLAMDWTLYAKKV